MDNPQPKYLTAVYDLAVSPLTFDIMQFLVAAEIERVRAGAGACHVVFVPEDPDKNADHRIWTFEQENRNWRFRQITLPATALMPSISQVTVCSDRDAASALFNEGTGPFYPEGYSVDAPIGGFTIAEVETAYLRGDNVPSLRASKQAGDYVNGWIKNFCGGRQVITITLRETSYGHDKNSDIGLWSSFAGTLDPDIYCPVFVRDTDALFEPPRQELSTFLEFSPASVNLELRAALYENSFINMIGSNGPSHVCLFNDAVTCIATNWGTDEWFDTRPEAYRKFMGVGVGDQLPHSSHRQKLVWGPENLERIIQEFDAMARVLTEEHPDRKAEHSQESICKIARQLLDDRQWGPARKLYRHFLDSNPDDSLLHYCLGLCETWLNNPSGGLAHLDRALELGEDTPDLYCARSEALAFLGRTEQSIASLVHAVTLDSDHFDGLLRLATILEASGRLEEAKPVAERAVAVRDDSADAYNILSIIHSKLGAGREAGEAADQARQLRELRDRPQAASTG